MPIPEEFKKFKDKIYDFFQQNNIIPPNYAADREEEFKTLQSDLLNKDKLIEELQSNLTESITLAEALQSKIDELSAGQSVPPNLADPKLNINKNLSDEETAGKLLLKELPYQDRMKLKANS